MVLVLVVIAAVCFFGIVARRTESLRGALGDERGEVTEKVIITALFAALALTAATIITLKVTDKANRIPTDTPTEQPSDGGLGG